jgi:hypothetical protein
MFRLVFSTGMQLRGEVGDKKSPICPSQSLLGQSGLYYTGIGLLCQQNHKPNLSKFTGVPLEKPHRFSAACGKLSGWRFSNVYFRYYSNSQESI